MQGQASISECAYLPHPGRQRKTAKTPVLPADVIIESLEQRLSVVRSPARLVWLGVWTSGIIFAD